MTDSNRNSLHHLAHKLGTWPETVLLLLLGFLVIWYGSTSSPRYGWMYAPDANIYLTMGQAWLQEGMFPYADLFDHKGPLIFLIDGLASLITPGGYTGLYLMESLAMGCTFIIWYRIALQLLGSQARRISLISVCTMAILIGSKALLPKLSLDSSILSQGGEAELYILCLMSLSLLALLKTRGIRGFLWSIIAGAALAGISLIKFNLVVYYPLFWAAVCLSDPSATWKNAAHSLLGQISGYLLIIAAMVLVFVLRGYGEQLWNVYIGFNAQYRPTLAGSLGNMKHLFLENTAFLTLGGIGAAALGWFPHRRNDLRGWACISLSLLSYLFLILMMNGVTIVPGYIYYLIPLLPYLFAAVLLFFHGLMNQGKTWEYALPALAALLYIRDTSIPRNEANNAAVIEELSRDITRHAQGKPVRLLCYGCMDSGLYRALRATPPVFYYMHPNDQEQPDRNGPRSIGCTQDRYIEKGEVDYVLMRYPVNLPPGQKPYYKNIRAQGIMQNLVEQGAWEPLGERKSFAPHVEVQLYARKTGKTAPRKIENIQ